MDQGKDATVTSLTGWAENSRTRPTKAGAIPEPALDAGAYVIRVVLVDSAPPIWREVELGSDLRLDRVHEILQTAVGWTNSHLHKFIPDPAGSAGGVSLVTPFDVEEGETGVLESDVRLDQLLRQVGDTLTYVYDFGDYWQHTVTLQSIRPGSADVARVMGGERAAPPEDVGGISWYETLVQAAENPGSKEWSEYQDEIRLRGFDHLIGEFDLEEANAALVRDSGARAALTLFSSRPATSPAARVIQSILDRLSLEGQLLIGGYLSAAHIEQRHTRKEEEAEAATRVFRVLLDQVGEEGITLTSAGYLPPAAVIGLMAVLDPERTWFGDSNREVNTQPLLALREVSTQLGLTRIYKGRLLLTSRGKTLRHSPPQLWAHLAASLPPERTDDDRDIAALALLLIGAGTTEPAQFSRELDLLLAVAGWRFDGRGQYGNGDVFYRARTTRNILRWAGTGELFNRDHRDETLALPACRLLAAAALSTPAQ
jgi:hypothetical protein